MLKEAARDYGRSLKAMAPVRVHRSKRCYIDGKPRPRQRGLIHGVVAGCLVVAVWVAFFLIQLRKLDRRRWLLVGMGLGKLASYAASAALHLGTFCDLPSLTNALRLDLLAIPLSIGGNNVALARSPGELALLLGATALFFAANASLVRRQLDGAVGLQNRPGRTDAPRSALLALQCAFSYSHIAFRRGFDLRFFANVVLVVSTLLLSVPVSNAHAEEPMSRRVPWHKRGRNGFHEDMHVVLLVGDLSMLDMVARANVGW